MAEVMFDPIEFKNKLLKQLETKEITTEEFLRECAYWSLKEGFETLSPTYEPPKPQMLIEYENLPTHQQEKLKDKSEYWSQKEIYDYFNIVHSTRAKNFYNFLWLRDIFKWLPEEDYISRQKVRDRIEEFESFFRTQREEYKLFFKEV